jgi:hypothetical protein
LTNDNGAVLVLPQSLQSCGSNCYVLGDSLKRITLKAVPEKGYTFGGWTTSGLELPSGCAQKAVCRVPLRSIAGSASVGAEYVERSRTKRGAAKRKRTRGFAR